jgi:hypothetical protein
MNRSVAQFVTVSAATILAWSVVGSLRIPACLPDRWWSLGRTLSGYRGLKTARSVGLTSLRSAEPMRLALQRGSEGNSRLVDSPDKGLPAVAMELGGIGGTGGPAEAKLTSSAHCWWDVAPAGSCDRATSLSVGWRDGFPCKNHSYNDHGSLPASAIYFDRLRPCRCVGDS